MKLDLSNHKKYETGRTHAIKDASDTEFDILAAIASFDADPADSPFQHGYLRGLRNKLEGE